jgi:nucleoside-diphosphate-sugar epimerase
MITKIQHNTAFVSGATSQIGYFLIPRLLNAGFNVIALSRQPHFVKQGQGISWKILNLQEDTISFPHSSVLFHAAPLFLLPNVLARLPMDTHLQRVIAFSSTSIFTKIESSDSKERAIINALVQAESALIAECEKRAIAWTIFRPTMIYGCGRDKSITFITSFIQRFGFFPILGNGQGLRQPVHADDLALACIQSCDSTITYSKSYNLSGGETINYRQMVERIFIELGKKPRIFSIPLSIFTASTALLRWFPLFSHLSPAMVKRISQNLCFDSSVASQDFNYQPRPFGKIFDV